MSYNDLPDVVSMRRVEDLLARLTTLRRHPRLRQILAEGTDLEGRITTMRILRAVDELGRTGMAPSVRAVAERLGMERSHASRAVEDGVERGLVVKRQAPDDARRVELSLTPRGEDAIGRLNVRRDAVHGQLLGEWPSNELHSLEALLEKLCRSYEALEQ